MKVDFKRFSGRAKASIRATSGSAGYDLFSAQCIELKPHWTTRISTNIGFKISKDHCGKICLRSSLRSIGFGAGVMQSDYCGIVYFVLHNLLKNFFSQQ